MFSYSMTMHAILQTMHAIVQTSAIVENLRPRKQDVQTRSETGVMRVSWYVGYSSLKPFEKWSSQEAMGALPNSKGTVHA